MKTKLLTLTLLVASLTAFAQGKIIIGNDSLHLVVQGFSPGLPWPQVGGWTSLSMTLMGGPSAGTMTLQTTIVGDAIGNPALPDGRINNRNWTMIGVGSATTAFLQLQFFSTAAGDFNTALLNHMYLASATPVFTVVTGTFANNSIVLHSAPGNSTWADGRIILGVPEPSIAALTGLATLLMIFRRRQK